MNPTSFPYSRNSYNGVTVSRKTKIFDLNFLFDAIEKSLSKFARRY